MTIIAFRAFGGEVPRLPKTLLPENASQDAQNCDLAHGELRGVRHSGGGPLVTSVGSRLRAIYTEEGDYFYGWPYDCYPVRSMVVDDIHHRLYYTLMLPDGPLAKVARTHRNNDGALTRIIGGGVLPSGGNVPNYGPPELTTPGMPGGIANEEPDAWVLGVPAPKVMADIEEDNLPVTLEDRNEWPGAPGLQLRVTLFYEGPAGEIVYQTDISNYEVVRNPYYWVGGPEPEYWRNVFYTLNDADRRGKMQDMWWAMTNEQRPYKYYFFLPPTLDLSSITRPAIVTNPGTTAATFEFATSRQGSGGPPVQVA